MDDATLAFIIDSGLALAYESGLWRVYAPGGTQGTGATLAEALAAYCAGLVDTRAALAGTLDGYAALDGADAAVLAAHAEGVAVPVKVRPDLGPADAEPV